MGDKILMENIWKDRSKKGDMISMLYVIIALVVIGITVFFASHIVFNFESQLYDTIDAMPSLDETNETKQSLNTIIESDRSTWDYAFLGVAIGYILAIFIFTYQTPISPVFYWISVILAMFWLFIGTLLSNLWQGIAARGELADTALRFPIMNTMLGTYYPTIVTFILIIGMVILFGKPLGGSR